MRTVLLLVLMMSISSSALAQTQIGNFTYEARLNPMTEDNVSHFYGIADDNSKLALVVKCLSDGLNVVLVHKRFSGDEDDQILVSHRFDKDDRVTTYWDVFPSHKSSRLPVGHITEFLRRARTANQVVIRATDPPDGETKTSVISLNGFGRALDRLEGCR